MTGDMGDTGTTTRRKKGNKVSLSVNVAKKEKKTREVVGAEMVKDVDVKEDIVTENVEEELTEKLATLLERDRSGGDGESLPVTPPNEAAIPAELVTPAKPHQKEASNPFTLNIKVDSMAMVLLITGIFSRMFRLESPRSVVFDEMHYGKYASLYLKNTFFFDSNPPLGKMMIAGAGYLAGFDGRFSFDKIGQEYAEGVPLWHLRFLPAFCGSLMTPTVYLIMTELGLTHYAGALAGFMVLFDTAVLAQSRFILMESIMMFFGLASLLCVLKFRKVSCSPFTKPWFLWLSLSALLMAAGFCVKYIGIYTSFLCTFLLFQDFWRLLPNKKLSDNQLLADFAVRVSVLTLVPSILYLSLFSLHFSILTKAGTHDALMTSQFQASLEGGLGSIIRGQPGVIAHGSQVTLRHTHGKTCWMHSHEHVYPVRYADGRGSSHQQQVSCYTFKDVNNWWIIKRPNREDLAVQEPIDRIKHGDVIQIVHGLTHRALNSHDVAAPVSPHSQEVSCYIDYNISMSAQNLWKVDIINRDTAGEVWHTINSQVRLIHVNTTAALKFSGKQYPDWGFVQHEVVTDRNINQADTVWNVEEHRYTKNDKDKSTIEREMMTHELIPEQQTVLSFWDKFLELQFKMLITNQENVQNHNFASDPTEWPFLTRGIAYYIAKDSNNQVHLMGNIVVWYTASSCLVLYTALLVFYLLRRRRLCFDIDETEFEKYVQAGEVLLTGYFAHYLPYFFYDRTLFLHHYLPAYIFKLMLSGYFISHMSYLLKKMTSIKVIHLMFSAALFVWAISVVYVFQKFSVLSYAHQALSAAEVRDLRWKDTWDLIIHKK